MKRIQIVLIALLSAPGLSHAQVAPAAPDAPAAAPAITERGPHHRTWSRVSYETNRQGQITAVTNVAYVELATGLHFRDPATGQWVESDPRFELTPDGYAVARRGQHQVILSPNINDTDAVDLQMPDGARLTSRPLGLAFHDAASGSNVLIATLKDCAGRWLPPAEIFYPDAFDGLHAGLRYTYTRQGFEQDVVLYENPGSPAAYGLNPATTRLEMWTEFFTAPTPHVTPLPTEDGDDDERVEFGAMALGQGQAYFLSLANHDEPSLPVKKLWRQIGGRTFLVEAVRYASARPFLQRLAAVTPATDSMLARRVTTGREALLAQLRPPPTREPKRLAGITPGRRSAEPSLVLDYTTLNTSLTNFTFQGDTTYYVSGLVNLSGTTTIEGGAVVKFTNSSSAKIAVGGSGLVCLTGPYRPAVFTSKDDNTVGDIITGSTGSPTNTGATFLEVTAGANAIQSLRFSYAGTALAQTYGPRPVWHCQFLKCNIALSDNPMASSGIQELHNVLLAQCSLGLMPASGTVVSAQGEHVTADQIGQWWVGSGSPVNTLTNSILTAIGNLGSTVTLVNSRQFGSGAGVFTNVGAASYYLADSSTNRNAGTTIISAILANDLKSRTTYPPLLVASNFTVNTVLSPQAQRDTDTPDLGYHYDPLDYVAYTRTVSANLTLTNGVALGTYGALNTYGLALNSGSFVSEGTPTRLNWVARYNTVQEQSTTNWSASTVGAGIQKNASSVVSTRFTGWSLLGAAGTHFNSTTSSVTDLCGFSHSQFAGGKFTIAAGWSALTNCLWQRVYVTLNDNDETDVWYLFNNLFYGGTLYYRSKGGSSTLQAYDNLFDKTTITQSGTIGTFAYDYNGYVTNKNRFSPNGAHDVILTNSPVYQTTWLGRYYYPTNDGNLSRLIDAGSRWATNATLYHFTTTTNQVKEASSIVDIGFHYVAVDPNTGLPYDTDGDGVPDYLEDRDGNGTVESGETDWNNPNDVGLKVTITRPKAGGP